MKNMVKNIVFDVGMVLIDFCWKRVCRKLGFEEHIIRDFDEHIINSDYWGRLDKGLIDLKEAIAGFIENVPQYESEINLFWEHAEEFVEEYDYVVPMIQQLQERGYNVYMLSNYPKELYELHWPKFKFYNMVNGYIVSAQSRLAKPDPAIYRLLCDKYGLKAEECLFFDDRQINVDAAIEVGMQAVLFEGYDTVKEKLGLA